MYVAYVPHFHPVGPTLTLYIPYHLRRCFYGRVGSPVSTVAACFMKSFISVFSNPLASGMWATPWRLRPAWYATGVGLVDIVE